MEKLRLLIDGMYAMIDLENEYGIRRLQKLLLPQGAVIACCLTCRHGTVEPFGEIDNFIYCLKGHEPKDKLDSVHCILNFDIPTHELLHWCDDYIVIDREHYVYNDVQFDFFPDMKERLYMEENE